MKQVDAEPAALSRAFPCRLAQSSGDVFERELLTAAPALRAPAAARARLAAALGIAEEAGSAHSGQPGERDFGSTLRPGGSANASPFGGDGGASVREGAGSVRRLAKVLACCGLGALLIGAWVQSSAPSMERPPSPRAATVEAPSSNQSAAASTGPSDLGNGSAESPAAASPPNAESAQASALLSAPPEPPARLGLSASSALAPPLKRAAVPLRSSTLPRKKERSLLAPSETLQMGAMAGNTASARSPESSLQEELREIDEARRAQRSGDRAEARRLLDIYRERFPGGELRLEAEVIAIDLAWAEGDHSEARARAERLLARPGASTYRSRLKAVFAPPPAESSNH